MLLTTLNLLAGGGQSIVNMMMMAALPSTLVKCLYLFFDLPEIPKEEEEKKEEGGGELTPTKRRELLHKYVVQVSVVATVGGANHGLGMACPGLTMFAQYSQQNTLCRLAQICPRINQNIVQLI